ncbi:MAG: hypothetical protein M3R36_01235 [Bacteroidota bacterium]|nr:hypothetical protein [Bacteroidota bacterium]
MKKIIVTLLYVFIVNLSLSSGNHEINNEPTKDIPAISKTPMKRVFVGGDIGASFGEYTVVRVSPLIGYNVSPYVSTGVKFVYMHSWEDVNQGTVSATTLQSNTIGGNFFVQYNPVKTFFLKGEFEYDSFKNYATTQNTAENIGVPFLFLGAGYTTPISRNTNFNLGIKVDVLNNKNSPFPDYNPFFSAGITAGI